MLEEDSPPLRSLVDRAARRQPRALAVGILAEGRRTIIGRGLEQDRVASALFEIGSITKALTGILLARMHLAGEVDLADPLSRHLPSELAPEWREAEPTLADLASHRAGLPNAPPPLARRELAYALGLRREDPWSAVSPRDYRDLVRAVRSRGAAEKVRYSSLGFGLLGEALAHRAGIPYETLLRARLCEPLGMSDTWIEVPADRRGRLLGGHSHRGRPRPPLADLMPAAGSVRSDVADMLVLLDACLRPPDDQLGGALALAQAPIARSSRVRIGLGWIIREHKRRAPVVWHNGGTWGFRSFAGFVPGAGVGTVVFANSTRDVTRLGLRILDAASGA